MNLRTLKKLSKLAAPMLAPLGDKREQFLSVRGDNIVCSPICEKKHWERNRVYNDSMIHGRPFGGVWASDIKTSKDGWPYRVVMRPPYHPRKGTPMVGSMDGYDQPEWYEEDAWRALCNLVEGAVFIYDPVTDTTSTSRPIRTPAQVLAIAREMLETTNHLQRAAISFD